MRKLSYIAVDDECIFLSELSKMLEDYPYIEKKANYDDAFKAINMINKEKPDVVFLDYEMPGFNGLDVLKKINYSALVVFITSHLEPIQDIVNHGGKAQLKKYLTKPIKKDDLHNLCLDLYDKLIPDNTPSCNKILIPNGKKSEIVVDTSSLSFIKADGKYTDWYFLDKKEDKAITCSLKEARKILTSKGIPYIDNKSYVILKGGIFKRENDVVKVLYYNDGKKEKKEIAFGKSNDLVIKLKELIG
ncbi:MAG: response regulator [Bacteroidales bacterium]|jgi:CheY-like chemotaxis protein|nr:response regulator [Bacteroidales bacterium]